MSTRANVLIKDSTTELWYYRHSDGYPDGTVPTLTEFMNRVVSGEIRDNASQAAGWLVVIGHEDYQQYRDEYPSSMTWKVGAYEPTVGQHGDIEYLYVLDLDNKVIEVQSLYGDDSSVITFT